MAIDVYGLNSNDWALGWEETKQATILTNRSHVAIESWLINRFFEHQILLCGTSILSANSQWKVGCTLEFLASYINFPLTNAVISREVIPPNGTHLIVLPRHTGNFRIRVRVPPWHKDLSLIIYEWMGTYETFTEHLLLNQS